MNSPNSWKLRALIKKNLLILKRNIISTLFEIFFPIILILLSYAIRKAFILETFYFSSEEGSIENYIQTRSISNIRLNNINPDINKDSLKWLNLSILPALYICSNKNAKRTPRPIIATIGIPQEIKDILKEDINLYVQFKMVLNISFKDFESIDKLNNYVKDAKYGQSNYPLICFGMSFKKDGKKYNYSLHYFDSIFDEGVRDIDNVRNGLFDRFKTGPDLDSYNLYQRSGYTYIMKLINDYILRLNNIHKTINFGIIPMIYKDYRTDPFTIFVGYMIPFFIIIAYMCPLCLYVYRMVSEKENKSKEGMKIMGLKESIYFLSYFIQYIIINLIDSIINTILLSWIFTKIPFYLIFSILFLWSLDLFALIFFFQSIIDKTRVALILSLLIYFVMYFISMACMNEGAAKYLKIILSIFPPVCVELGIVLLGKFESHFKTFHNSDYTKIYTNYSIFIMNLMQLIDFFLYLFLGFYFQNVLPHEFGIKRPYNFLCSSDYWCKKKKNNKFIGEIEKENNIIIKSNVNKIIIGNNDDKNSKLEILEKGKNRNEKEIAILKRDKNFEREDLYKDKTKPDDALRIIGIKKIFDDGKIAVDGVNLNFYKDEIFALLGHNGAGKTTLISMLTGLYEATEGKAYYDGYDILESNNMDKFRSILGICPQHDVLFDDLTIKEHLEMFCIFKGYKSKNIENEINKTLDDFELKNIRNIRAKNLSAGQRRKLSIAISLIGGSKIIFLDEPSSGMDITSRRNLWDILKRQSEQKIIILTTHYMEEASVLGKRIGIIDLGKMKCIGTPLFLIERFGKFINLNVIKEENANDDKIVEFINKRAKNVEYEILSEEIMFRIPKNKKDINQNINDTIILSENSDYSQNKENNENKEQVNSFNISKFFEDLDNNLKDLKIKTYNASMPTLEDVFLNVAAENNDKFKKKNISLKDNFVNDDNDKILFETNFLEDYSIKSKFCNDFLACFYRRFLLTSRDVKGFLMEILCPILLVLIGLLVSQVKILRSSNKQILSMDSIGKQTILYGGLDGINNLENYYFNNMKNITCKTVDFDKFDKDHKIEAIKAFTEKVFEISKDTEDSINHEVDMMDKDYSGFFGSLLMLKNGKDDDSYEFIEVLNTRVKHGVPIYTFFFLTKIIENEVPGIEINFLHYPLPLTAKLEQQSEQTNNNLVIFFVSIAFSLIPANFITIIIKEKISNSKHLMRISGINITAYWIVNSIFELIKYYFTCGICLLLLYVFNFYRNYLYILYLLYGPALIPMTYVLSFIFNSESSAQNDIILLNFLIGALGSVVILILRALENVKSIARILQYIFGLLPSFCFNFGYSLLLNKVMIYISEYPNEWFFFKDDILLKKFNLLLFSILYLGAEIIIYSFILFIIECCSYSFRSVKDSKIDISITDTQVLKERDLANQDRSQIMLIDNNQNDMNRNNITKLQPEYSVRIKNLRKEFSNGLCEKPTIAIKNMSFCVENGECFGLLGLNGAGKTTTFKCITKELAPTNGKIYINGKEIKNSFNNLSSVFGYCPQFDAIFEYMTVYENLEFYAKIKGIKKEFLEKVLNAMISEMSLSEFTNKMSGKLSGGNKRKLSVAISFLCNPQIVLLDEPSTGMDPEARRFMWSVIHKISTKGKKASVIMTTHSMDEAETLCKRMAIMVNGEFVCLGRSVDIKQKYGYGYEVEVRIKPLSEKRFLNILNSKFDKNLVVNLENINDILTRLNEKNFINELKPGRLGSKIVRDIQINNGIPIRTLVSWIFFVRNALFFIKTAIKYFEEIILVEHIDNNFLFKMKKNKNTKSIGFFFGLFESNKNQFSVTEYSIHQTSLEQIFNMFELKFKTSKSSDKKNNDIKEEENNQEIIINNEFYNLLL